MNNVIYLLFHGNAKEALNFYVDSMNAEVISIQHYYSEIDYDHPIWYEQCWEKVASANIRKWNLDIILSDIADENYSIDSHPTYSLVLETKDEGVEIFSKLSSSGLVIIPYDSSSWWLMIGSCKDKFGNIWMVNFEEK